MMNMIKIREFRNAMKGFDGGPRTLYNKDNIPVFGGVLSYKVTCPEFTFLTSPFFQLCLFSYHAHFFLVYFILFTFILELIIQPVFIEQFNTHKSREAFP